MWLKNNVPYVLLCACNKTITSNSVNVLKFDANLVIIFNISRGYSAQDCEGATVDVERNDKGKW
jgi:hypothetical protein